MFVFLGFMWLLSGMTGLLWGYQEGRLPTLEEVLPYVREATHCFFLFFLFPIVTMTELQADRILLLLQPVQGRESLATSLN